jgi:hypothetical protein
VVHFQRVNVRGAAMTEVGPTSAFYSCIPTGMRGSTLIFWASLTPFSLGSQIIVVVGTIGGMALGHA